MKTFPRPVWLPQRPRAGAGAPGESAGARRRSGGGPGTRIELQVTYIRLGFAVLALGILSPGAGLHQVLRCKAAAMRFSSHPFAPAIHSRFLPLRYTAMAGRLWLGERSRDRLLA